MATTFAIDIDENVEARKKLAWKIQDDETIRRWGRVSIGSRGCVLEVTEMDGNKAIAPPTKSEQNRSRCNCCSRGGGIVETIIEPGGTRCAILSGATVLVIASEAITYVEKIRFEATEARYTVIQRDTFMQIFSLWVFVRTSINCYYHRYY